MEQGDRMRFHQVQESIHRGWKRGFPRLWSRRSFILTTDWSKENITGVLSQVQDRQERFLGCWERKCNKSKRNYPSNKGELLAVIQCIKKLKLILNYQPFEVHTDVSALKYLTIMKNQFGLFTRWYQELADLNFTVIHKKGKEISNADALSRSSHMAETQPLEEDEYAKFYEIDEPVIKFEVGVNEIQQIQRSLIKIAEEQAKVEVWSDDQRRRRQDVKQERF